MRKGIHDRIGEERFRKLMETMSVPDMCVLLCTHHAKDELRRDCQACRRAIYRSINTLKQRDHRDKSLDVIDNFDKIPEIQSMDEFLSARGVIKSTRQHIQRQLFRMWSWVRESGNDALIQTQRPALWDIEHIQYILSRITEMRIARYSWVQALRRLFESQRRDSLLKHNLLRARRKDMRSPRGRRKNRVKDYATPEDFKKMLDACDSDRERLKLKIHVTLKSREGGSNRHRTLMASFCNLAWERVNWEDTFYGQDMPKVTVTVFETKTGGGTLWEHCPLDLYWSHLPDEFKAYWESEGCPKEGFVWGTDTYDDYLDLFHGLMEKTGLDLTPHDMRRTGATWLHNQGADNLAIGQYDSGTGRAIGFGGVGWENAEVYFKTYGRITREGLKKLWAHVHKEVALNGT